jgi:capsular polysaccharide transport system ATP-binding protein
MIEFVNVSKSYPISGGHNNILENVSFSFPENTNIGILGQNGAGKSTLLRLIAASESPDSGIIKRKGKFSWPLGFAGGFSPSLTGEENLKFVCRIYNADIKTVTEYVKDYSELGAFFYEPIRTYSSGMRSRLTFSLSMAIDFDVILVDEILSVGDQPFREKCLATIKEKSKTSQMIMVSHSLPMLRSFCDTMIVMHKGDLKIYTDIEEAINVYQNLN